MTKRTIILLVNTILLLISTQVFSNENIKITNGLWAIDYGGKCLDTSLYFPDGSVIIAQGTGKYVLGVYTLEKIKGSKRLKLTVKGLTDSGHISCDGSKFNYANKIFTMYIVLEKQNTIMRMGTSLKGNLLETRVKQYIAVGSQNKLKKDAIQMLQLLNQSSKNNKAAPSKMFQKSCGKVYPNLAGKWRNELFLSSGGYSESNMILYPNGTMSNDFYSDNSQTFTNEFGSYTGSSSVSSGTNSGTGGSWGVTNGRVSICFTNGVVKMCNLVDGSLMCDLPKSRTGKKELWSPVK